MTIKMLIILLILFACGVADAQSIPGQRTRDAHRDVVNQQQDALARQWQNWQIENQQRNQQQNDQWWRDSQRQQQQEQQRRQTDPDWWKQR